MKFDRFKFLRDVTINLVGEKVDLACCGDDHEEFNVISTF